MVHSTLTSIYLGGISSEVAAECFYYLGKSDLQQLRLVDKKCKAIVDGILEKMRKERVEERSLQAAPTDSFEDGPFLPLEMWDRIYTLADERVWKQAMYVNRASYHTCQGKVESRGQIFLEKKWNELKAKADKTANRLTFLMNVLEREERKKNTSNVDFHLLFQRLALRICRRTMKLPDRCLITTIDGYKNLKKQVNAEAKNKALSFVLIIPCVLYFTGIICAGIYFPISPSSLLRNETLFFTACAVVLLWVILRKKEFHP